MARHGRRRAPEAAVDAAPAADEVATAANNAAAAEPAVRHNPKVHHAAEEALPSAETAGHDGKSAAFVGSVLKQERSAPAALAAGAADEVAARDENERTGTSAEESTPQGQTPSPAKAYLGSRSMPAGALVARTPGERPHVPSVEEQVLTPTVLPAVQPLLYSRRGRLIMPPAMKGTHAILVHQNTMADSEGLTRIQDDADLLRMREDRLLVPLPTSGFLRVDERLPENRRYTRPWTEVFLATLSRAHYARFHTPLQVNSAVRTVQFQERLIHTNGNAAPAEGLTASPHLTGQAVDLAKHGLSTTEIAWLRGYLMPLVQEGKIDVEEEFQQSCFHISVYKGYLPQVAPRRVIAEKHHSHTAALASALR